MGGIIWLPVYKERYEEVRLSACLKEDSERRVLICMLGKHPCHSWKRKIKLQDEISSRAGSTLPTSDIPTAECFPAFESARYQHQLPHSWCQWDATGGNYLTLLSSTHLQCYSRKKVPALTDFITVTALTSAGSISGHWGLPLAAFGVSRASQQHRSQSGVTKLTCELCSNTSPTESLQGWT